MPVYRGIQARARLSVLLPILLCLAGTPLRAAFEDMGAGARAGGMGGAFTAVADDLNAYHYNPAGLGNLVRPQLGAMHSRLHMGLTDGSSLSVSELAYAYPIKQARRGTLAVALHQLDLSGLAAERSVYLSYGKLVWDGDEKGTLFVGGSLKHLSLSFTRPSQASNSLDLLAATGQEDPVLSGPNGKTALDTDLGLLYRYQHRYFAGLAVKHLNEPDLAFSSADKAPLPRAFRLGLGYKALWMNLASELRMDRSADGALEKEFALGAERYFATLHTGQLGLRGGLSFGRKDHRQLAAGLSYRINKIQVDYSFQMPLGALQGTAGTHRLGMTLHFGAPTPEEIYTADLVRKVQDAGLTGPGYAYEFEALPNPLPAALETERVSDVKQAIVEGRYGQAHELLTAHLTREAGEVALIAVARRLEEVKAFYPTLDRTQGAWAEAEHKAITDFLYGRDAESVLKASYALSLSSTAPNAAAFLARLEAVTNRKGERMPQGSALSLLELKLVDSERMFISANFPEVIKLGKDILVLEPEHATALARIGSAYYRLDKLSEAVAYWRRALAVETRAPELRTLKYMLGQAETRLKPAPAAPKPQPELKRRFDPQAVERVYQRGVELYTQGSWSEAAAAFQKILELDPGNPQAQRALRRIEDELMSRERVR